jgi:uracil phosphoribosyltransferase
MHTIIRDRDTKRSDFLFYCNRLSRLLMEEAMNQLPYESLTVVTPNNMEYEGVKLATELCGVSIMRAGEAMESSMKEVCGAIPILKILIQSNDKNPMVSQFFFCEE